MALRFPSDITQSGSAVMYLSIYKFDGFNLAELHNPDNFDIKKIPDQTIALPVPNNLQQNYSNRIESVESFGGWLRKSVMSATDMVNRVEASIGKSLFAPTANIVGGADAQTHQLSWKLIPHTKQEAEEIEKIADYLEMTSLQSVENFALAMMPDLVDIKIKNHNFISYMSCFIQSIDLNATSAGMFQQYEDGNLPAYELSLSLVEVTQRSKQIQKSLKSKQLNI